MVNISYASRIKLRIQQIQTEMSALARELDDLKIADRVLTRLSQGIDEHSGDLISNEARKKSKLTIADQIKFASESFGPLDSKALHRAISEKFGEEVAFASFASTLSRMRSSGRMQLHGTLWSAVENNSASSVETQEAVSNHSHKDDQTGAD